MKWTKCVSGVLTTLLGATGIILCLAVAITIWTVRNRVDQMVANVFERVDVVLTRLEAGTQQANQRIAELRDASRQLNDRVQQRIAELRDVPKEDAADIDQLERQLYSRMQQAKAWSEFTQATVELIGQVLEMTESASAFVQSDSHTVQGLVTSLRSGHEHVEVAAKLAEEVRQGLIEIRARENVQENARQIRTISARIDAALAKVASYGQEFAAGVSRARGDITSLRTRIRQRLTVVAIIGTLILLWMAAGQLSLAIHGRRIARPH